MNLAGPTGVELPPEDRALLGSFREVRQALADSDRELAERSLYGVERKVDDRLRQLRGQLLALAEANVNAVELVERLEAAAQAVQARHAQLAEQFARIQEVRQELEAQARAAAEANVDAVRMLEETESRFAEAVREREDLASSRQALAERARALEEEATALAAANAEAVTLVQEKEESIEKLLVAAREIEAARQALEEKAFLDELTGLFNHRYFREQIRFEIARARRYGRALALAFLDVDHFKHFNDAHGHLAGDAVLRGVAALIRAEVRHADIPVRVSREPFAARYGGEEFVVILPEADAAGARTMAERIRARIRAAAFPGAETQPLGRITVSAGVAMLGAGEDDPAALLRRADAALYQAKAAGRDRVELAAPG
jgi:diguanylate cyclase (GGDEF)-like protein